jgi:hypothetical protein
MSQEKGIILNKKRVKGSWEHSNVNKIRKYPIEDVIFVGRDEEKEDASPLLMKRLWIVIYLSGYIISLSSLIQKMLLLYDDSAVNLQTIITGIIGFTVQLICLIIFYWLHRDDLKAGNCCNCDRGDTSRFFLYSNVKFVLSILELLSIILLKSNDLEVDHIHGLFYLLVCASMMSYFLVIVMSLSSSHRLFCIKEST